MIQCASDCHRGLRRHSSYKVALAVYAASARSLWEQMAVVLCALRLSRAVSMIPLLSFLAPARLWLLLLIPLLVLLYLWMVQRRRNRNNQVSKTMFDLVIP